MGGGEGVFLPYSVRRRLACSAERPCFGELESRVYASSVVIVCHSRSESSRGYKHEFQCGMMYYSTQTKSGKCSYLWQRNLWPFLSQQHSFLSTRQSDKKQFCIESEAQKLDRLNLFCCVHCLWRYSSWSDGGLGVC